MDLSFLKSRQTSSIAIVAVLYVIYRLGIFASYDKIVIWFDSADYFLISGESVTGSDFWSARRPALYPLVMKAFADETAGGRQQQERALGRGALGFHPKLETGRELDRNDFPKELTKLNATALAIFQLIFSAGSWLVLAIAAMTRVQNQVIKWLALVGLLGISTDSSLTVWDIHILTESLGISLAALSLGVLILFSRKPNIPMAVVIIVLASLMCLLRTPNIYFLLASSAAGLILFLFLVITQRSGGTPTEEQEKSQKLWLMTLFLVLLTSYFHLKVTNASGRGIVPLTNVITGRAMNPDFEDLEAYLRERGMPELPQSFYRTLWRAPFQQQPAFRPWLVTYGEAAYRSYLLTHPGYFLVKPWQVVNDGLNVSMATAMTPDLSLYQYDSANLLQVFFSRGSLIFLLLTGGGLVVYSVTKRKLIDFKVVAIGTLLGASIFMCYVIWHGDVVEVNRHMLQANLYLRLFLFAGILLMVDAFVQGRQHINSPPNEVV